MIQTNTVKYLLALGAMCLPVPSFASGFNGADTAWVMICTVLVLFMTLPGLALFYSGLVRVKNVLSVLMQCFSVTCLISVLWMMFGYGLSFGQNGTWHGIIGIGPFFMSDIDWATESVVAANLPATVFFMFQMSFAIITPVLIVGSFAERMRFSAVLWFSGLWFLLVYAPVCHWVWSDGWLHDLGFMDFAGGVVVHVNAGVAALVAALMLGRRRGFPDTTMLPHNMTLTVVGAAILWVGWFGFNAGSTLVADGAAGMAMVVTQLAAATGALAWMACEWYRHAKPSILGVVTGMVAGLVTITPASGFVGPVGGVMIGLCSGVVCYSCTHYMKRVLKVDDALDVFPVHGIGGMLGTLLTAVFAHESLGGVGLATALWPQLGIQTLGMLAVLAWCVGLSFLLLKVLDRVIGIRVPEEEEIEGLDVTQHNERAYSLS